MVQVRGVGMDNAWDEWAADLVDAVGDPDEEVPAISYKDHRQKFLTITDKSPEDDGRAHPEKCPIALGLLTFPGVTAAIVSRDSARIMVAGMWYYATMPASIKKAIRVYDAGGPMDWGSVLNVPIGPWSTVELTHAGRKPRTEKRKGRRMFGVRVDPEAGSHTVGDMQAEIMDAINLRRKGYGPDCG